MALNPVGFDGTVLETQWAEISRFHGQALPVVLGASDFKVSIVSGVDRTVSIAAGVSWAHGLRVTSTAADTLQLAALNTAGQTRWDAIVLRRDWAENIATLVAIPGTPAVGAPRAVPSGLQSSIGTDQFDQLLALVQITAGQTAPSGLWDARLYPTNAVAIAPDLAAVVNPPIGAQVLTPGGQFRRGLDSSGNAAWLSSGFSSVPTRYLGTAVGTQQAGGWSQGGVNTYADVSADGYWVHVHVEVRRTVTTVITPDATGKFPAGTIPYKLLPKFVPDRRIPAAMAYESGATFTNRPGTCVLETDGNVVLLSGDPSQPLTGRGAVLLPAFWVDFSYARLAKVV